MNTTIEHIDAVITTTAEQFAILFNDRPRSIGLQVQGPECAYAVDSVTDDGSRVTLSTGQLHHGDDEIVTREMSARREIRVRVRTYNDTEMSAEDRMQRVRALLAL